MKKLILFAVGVLVVDARASDFDGAYVSVGVEKNVFDIQANDITTSNNALGHAIADLRLRKVKLDRSSAILLLGYGTTFGGIFYLSAEGSADFTKRKDARVKCDAAPGQMKETAEKYGMKSGNFIPAVGFRFGLVVPGIGALIYAKATYQFPNITIYDDKQKKITNIPALPAFGLGIEKAVGAKFSIRAEAERVFRLKIKKKFKIPNNAGLIEEHHMEAKNGGYNVRLLLSYNI
jgi:hypothetical protein